MEPRCFSSAQPAWLSPKRQCLLLCGSYPITWHLSITAFYYTFITFIQSEHFIFVLRWGFKFFEIPNKAQKTDLERSISVINPNNLKMIPNNQKGGTKVTEVGYISQLSLRQDDSIFQNR